MQLNWPRLGQLLGLLDLLDADVKTQPRTLLVATVKNEGPNILEWVAHHLCIGFDKILIYQNDSDDETQKSLRTLSKIGAIDYHRNHSFRPDWQTKAYKRASRTEEYAQADWCMTLDGDEFLHVKVGDGKVTDLIAASPDDADEILVNWKIFGSGGQTDLNQKLVTERFTLAERDDAVKNQFAGVKSLIRTDKFKRPGIHRGRAELVPDIRSYNASGLPWHSLHHAQWRANDPGQRKYAQVNHYAIRDASSYLIKADRGSVAHPDREVKIGYWTRFDQNEEHDHSLSSQTQRVWDKMRELDDASRGRLMALRDASFKLWQDKLSRLLADDEFRKLARQMGADDLLEQVPA